VILIEQDIKKISLGWYKFSNPRLVVFKENV